MVGADSHKISRALRYLGTRKLRIYTFAYEAVTLYGCPFQSYFANINTSAQDLHILLIKPHNTNITTHASLHDIGLGYSQFAHHYYGNHVHFLFLALLRCFNSRRSLFYPIYSDKSFLVLPGRVSPFGNLRIKAHLSAPRSLSQTITSFIVS